MTTAECRPPLTDSNYFGIHDGRAERLLSAPPVVVFVRSRARDLYGDGRRGPAQHRASGDYHGVQGRLDARRLDRAGVRIGDGIFVSPLRQTVGPRWQRQAV